MPKYYCDYCDTFLTHDSPSVRKTHCGGRFHRDNVRKYYQEWLEQQVQKLVDQTTESFKQGRIPGAPIRAPLGLPPPPGLFPPRPMLGMQAFPGGPLPPPVIQQTPNGIHTIPVSSAAPTPGQFPPAWNPAPQAMPPFFSQFSK